MTKMNLIVAGLIAILVMGGSLPIKKRGFTIRENAEGIELFENGDPVFFFQSKPKSPDNKVFFNNYLHPVYNLSGEVISEEFPADHLHHRGFFWAWHQLFIDNMNLGDGWMMEKISQNVVRVDKKMSNKVAQFNLNVLWNSSVLQTGKPFIEENTRITVYRKEADLRKIDFEITLKPLVEGVRIGGSDDEKGYGGFCVRVKLTPGSIFTSENGPVKPQNLQISSGSWMDISTGTGPGGVNGVTILCHPSVPNYPAPWILRQEKSMQNIVYPGRERIALDKPVVLKYRVIIHNGNATSIDIENLRKEYEK
jgi:hypothetical protein